ncbi:hypothetical protein [Mesorhizobium sp. WSM3876]|uniref:hypothetical protein n=1 Tax=Mesorhizobium sp. WSM3876 TaxID=422277 RepID=UPI001140F2D3|nr:hypothetical protein [Mesorhizobium sp. WSM3876]
MSSSTPTFEYDTALEWISGSPVTVPAALATGLSMALTPMPAGACEFARLEVSRRGNSTQVVPDFKDALRRADFLRVYQALDELQSLHPSEDYFIEGEVAHDARHALSLVYMLAKLPSPKLLPHDSDTLAFSWSAIDDKKLYLTVSEGSASLMETSDSKSQMLGCSDLKDGSVVGLVQTLGAHVRRTAEAKK